MTTIVFESSPDWYKVLYPFVIHPGKTISMSATVFMVVAVSADRQRAICHPMLYRVRNLKPSTFTFFSVVRYSTFVEKTISMSATVFMVR